MLLALHVLPIYSLKLGNLYIFGIVYSWGWFAKKKIKPQARDDPGNPGLKSLVPYYILKVTLVFGISQVLTLILPISKSGSLPVLIENQQF